MQWRIEDGLAETLASSLPLALAHLDGKRQSFGVLPRQSRCMANACARSGGRGATHW